LKQDLDQGRTYEKKKIEERNKQNTDKFEEYKKKLEAEGKMLSEDSRETYKKFKETQVEEEIKNHDELLYSNHGFGLETGNYELVAVLTHKGRSADSGHYVSWIHKTGGLKFIWFRNNCCFFLDEWYQYDDDLVTNKKLDDVLNLRGGGDWHMAYYCVYRKLEIQ